MIDINPEFVFNTDTFSLMSNSVEYPLIKSKSILDYFGHSNPYSILIEFDILRIIYVAEMLEFDGI